MTVIVEMAKLNSAIKKVSAHLDEMSQIALETYGEDNAEIFNAQKMILSDEGFYSSICKYIEENNSAVDAIEIVKCEYEEELKNLSNEYIKAKSTDIADIANRLINVINGRALVNRQMSTELSGIIKGDELTASDILMLDKDKVDEIVFSETPELSHRVIIAKEMGFKVTFN